MSTVLLDTTVLIDLSRGDEQSADFIEQEREAKRLLSVSVVSTMELIVGCRNKIEVGRAKQLIAELFLFANTTRHFCSGIRLAVEL